MQSDNKMQSMNDLTMENLKMEDSFYTLIYCKKHNIGTAIKGYATQDESDGSITKGYYDSPPENYKMNHLTECDHQDWHNMGVIYYGAISKADAEAVEPEFNTEAEFDQADVQVVKSIRMTYDDFQGDFKFGDYKHNITTNKGHELYLNEDSKLYGWFKTICS